MPLLKGTAMTVLASHVTYDQFRTSYPQAHDALIAMGAMVDAHGFEKELTELIKLRISQLNGCSFCLQLHLTIARRIGLNSSKIDLLPTWRESGIYSDREAAALAWAEVLTILPGHDGLPNKPWQALRQHFSEEEASLLTVTIATINSWNRIAIGFQFAPQGAVVAPA
jgi:AhpD family alkylhydroperoxidase